MSHTIKTKVKYALPVDGRDSPLARAVIKMGGTWLGEGKHRLYQGTESGYGFTLPEWRYPLVLSQDGELHYDNYSGNWGNTRSLSQLEDFYAVEAARAQANNMGLLVEEAENGAIKIYAPGGIVRVELGGLVDVSGAVGGACEKVSQPFVEAIGGKLEEVKKAEYFVEQAKALQGGES